MPTACRPVRSASAIRAAQALSAARSVRVPAASAAATHFRPRSSAARRSFSARAGGQGRVARGHGGVLRRPRLGLGLAGVAQRGVALRHDLERRDERLLGLGDLLVGGRLRVHGADALGALLRHVRLERRDLQLPLALRPLGVRQRRLGAHPALHRAADGLLGGLAALARSVDAGLRRARRRLRPLELFGQRRDPRLGRSELAVHGLDLLAGLRGRRGLPLGLDLGARPLLAELLRAPLVQLRGRVALADGAVELGEVVAQRGEAVLHHRQLVPPAHEVLLLQRDRLALAGLVEAQRVDVGAGGGAVLHQREVLGEGEPQLAEPDERAVAPELGGLEDLTLEGAQVARHLVDHVGGAVELRGGGLEPLLGLVASGLVAGDAGGLVDERAALLRGGRDHLVDLALLDERVQVVADARVEQQLDHVASAHARLVERVLGGARAVQAAAHLDLGERGVLPRERRAVVGHQRQHDLGVAHGLAIGGAGEDDVGHLAAAQALGGLLADAPLQRVHDVRLPAAVRPDDAGDPRTEVEGRAVGEGLEAVQLEPREPHVYRRPITVTAAPAATSRRARRSAPRSTRWRRARGRRPAGRRGPA
ncbi:MAG: hypothetical protein R3F59_38570, partial [Myxococcota bacterium]